MSQTITSSDVRDQYGRTGLMNYVIQKEIEMNHKQYEFRKFWNNCFYEKSFYSYSIQLSSGQWMHMYDSVILRRMYTTDAEVMQCKKLENELDAFIVNILENIRIMVFNGANLQARDSQGKSVVDHCSSYKIHSLLRELGAPRSLFQENCIQFLYGCLTVTAVTVSALTLAALYKTYILKSYY